MRKKRKDHRTETDDLWRGSRLVIILAVVLLAMMIAAVLRAGESASQSDDDSDASLRTLVSTYDLGAEPPWAADAGQLV